MERRIDIQYYDSGTVKRIGGYKEKMKDGQWTLFYESGLVKWIGTYLDGVEFGIWKEWYADGTLKEEYRYKEGVKVALNFWDEAGHLTLADGTGYTIETFGANDHDVYKHYYKDGCFCREEKVSETIFGAFVPSKQ